MQTSSSATVKISEFVYRTFPLARQRALGLDDPLLESGIVDSLGVLQIVDFIETEFDLILSDDDVASDVFGSIGSVAAFVEARLNSGSAV